MCYPECTETITYRCARERKRDKGREGAAMEGAREGARERNGFYKKRSSGNGRDKYQ